MTGARLCPRLWYSEDASEGYLPRYVNLGQVIVAACQSVPFTLISTFSSERIDEKFKHIQVI